MRWPWVSRELADMACAQVRDYAARLQMVTRNYDALLEKYHALKMQGATFSEPTRVVEQKRPDPVQDAITEKSGNRHGLKLHLTGWAAKQRALNVEDDKIINAITNWRSESDDE